MTQADTTDSTDVAVFAAAVDDFMRASRRARGRLAAEGDLSLSQYHLLEPLLSADGPLGVSELASAAGVSAPTATRMLATLERDALVERRACAGDRRVVHIALTAEGERRVARKGERIATRRAEIFASLATAERRQAARILTRLAAAIEELR
jgi:MarR family transcriptional regulator, organic hydroperoxide resistance regulator